MVYVVFGVGEATPLDKEHIINTMFRVALYGKKAVFFKNSSDSPNSANILAIEAAKEWKVKNETKVELLVIDEDDPKQKALIPTLFDCIVYFITEDTDKDPLFKEQQTTLAQEGMRVEKYILGTWDKKGSAY